MIISIHHEKNDTTVSTYNIRFSPEKKYKNKLIQFFLPLLHPFYQLLQGDKSEYRPLPLTLSTELFEAIFQLFQHSPDGKLLLEFYK